MKLEVVISGGGISSSLEPPPMFTKCATQLPFPPKKKVLRIAPVSNFVHILFVLQGSHLVATVTIFRLVVVPLGLPAGWEWSIWVWLG